MALCCLIEGASSCQWMAERNRGQLVEKAGWGIRKELKGTCSYPEVEFPGDWRCVGKRGSCH